MKLLRPKNLPRTMSSSQSALAPGRDGVLADQSEAAERGQMLRSHRRRGGISAGQRATGASMTSAMLMCDLFSGLAAEAFASLNI